LYLRPAKLGTVTYWLW